MKRKKMMKKKVLSPQRAGTLTSVIASQRQPLDKKTVLKSKIQDILNGKSRFVIRTTSAGSTREKNSNGDDWETSTVSSGFKPVSRTDEKEKTDR